jgi:hypothetical protein
MIVMVKGTEIDLRKVFLTLPRCLDSGLLNYGEKIPFFAGGGWHGSGCVEDGRGRAFAIVPHAVAKIKRAGLCGLWRWLAGLAAFRGENGCLGVQRKRWCNL